MAVVTALFDRIVDQYEEYADRLGEKVEEQDRQLLDPTPPIRWTSLRRTAEVRHAVLRLRRATGQLRELVGVLVRHELVAPGHTDSLDLELRDVYDHVVRAHDDLDILYERLASLADTRLAITAYRQNEITKKLSAWGGDPARADHRDRLVRHELPPPRPARLAPRRPRGARDHADDLRAHVHRPASRRGGSDGAREGGPEHVPRTEDSGNRGRCPPNLCVFGLESLG